MDAAQSASRAELAKNLLKSRGFGVLSTLSQRVPEFPFGSVVTYAVDDAGCPIFLLSRLAVHTNNLLANPKASLLVFDQAVESEPLNSARVNFFGEIQSAPEGELARARSLYLERHPDAAQWVDFGDFGFYRMAVAEAYYVGGFGVMGWIGGTDLAAH
jgi:putative heme iron utilization protein